MAPLHELLGESRGIQAVRDTVGRLLAHGAEGRRLPALLIQGETGTGKGLLARALHRAGSRAAGPLVEVNCAAIPETLLEAELFGFERGAFTDARQPKTGLFQTAHGGTLFLDEVGLLPERVQAKFLKVLEDGAVRRLGSTQSEPADVAIVAATSEDLLDAVRGHRFREDLYHRLAVVTVRLPPLAERGTDILLLAEHFLERACADYGLARKRLAPAACEALRAYAWPGNIRELANVMERAALLTDTPLVTADALGLPVAPGVTDTAPVARASPLREAMGTLEREHLLEALRETDWNIARAAARLGIPRGTLRYRIEKLGLQRSGAPPTRAGPPASQAMPEPVPPARAAPTRDAWPWERRQIAFLRVTLVPPPDRYAGAQIERAREVLVEKVESFGGRVEAAGPRGVVAAFGLESVEDAPRRAAHAAIATRKAAERARPTADERVSVKMAIHVSYGLVGWAGDAPTIDVAAIGDAHAVLEPLVAAAEPDSILVTAAAARTLERRFELVPIGPDDATRAPAYRLEDLERPGLALRGHMTPLVGRGAELEQLHQVLGRAAAGHGQLVAIVGEPGVGKSRLVWEVMQASRRQGWHIEHAGAVSYGQATPFQPVIALLRAYFHLEDRDDPPAIREKVGGQLATLDPALASHLPALRAMARGATREAIAHLEQALETLRRLPETRQTTERTIDIHLDIRNALEALDWASMGEPLEEAEVLARALGDPHRLARITTFRLDECLGTGRWNEAIEFGQEALRLARALGDRATEAVATSFLGVTHLSRGDLRDAATLFERNVLALEGDLCYERFGSAFVHSAFSEANLADVLSQLGRFDEAIAHADAAVRTAEAADHPLTLYAGLRTLGLAHLRRGDLPHATPVLERNLDHSRTWQFVSRIPIAAAALGAAYTLAGRAEEALPLVAGAVNEFRRRPHFISPAFILLCAGTTCLSAGRIDEARSHAREALTLSRRLGARGSEAHALCLAGDVASASSDEDAEGHYHEALALAIELGMRPLVAHCHLGLGRLYRRTGDWARGHEHLTTAATMYREMDMGFWVKKVEANLRPPLRNSL